MSELTSPLTKEIFKPTFDLVAEQGRQASAACLPSARYLLYEFIQSQILSNRRTATFMLPYNKFGAMTYSLMKILADELDVAAPGCAVLDGAYGVGGDIYCPLHIEKLRAPSE